LRGVDQALALGRCDQLRLGFLDLNHAPTFWGDGRTRS
jgi:hypothetical protein